MDNSELIHNANQLDQQLQNIFDEDSMGQVVDEALAAFRKVREQKEKELRCRLKIKK